MKTLAVAILCCAASIVGAGNLQTNIGWQPSLKFEDGSQMKWSEIRGYEIHYTLDSDFAEMNEPIFIQPSEQITHVLDLNIEPREAPYILRVAMKTVSIYNTKSDVSNVVQNSFKVSSSKTPLAPISITIQIECDDTCVIIDSKLSR